MKKYLVRKCPDCKGIVRIIKENGVIIETEGLAKIRIMHKNGVYTVDSKKMVRCIHPLPGLPSLLCCRDLLVSKFQEIKA